MAERKSEVTAYFSTDASAALDILAETAGLTRAQWASKVLINEIAKEVDRANLLAQRLAGKRIARNLDE